jgi:hypothetical protein
MYDILMAQMYAEDMVSKEKCESKEIKKLICPHHADQCMEWKEDTGVRHLWDVLPPFVTGRKCDPNDSEANAKCNAAKGESEPGPQTCLQNNLGEHVCGFKMSGNRGYCLAKEDGCGYTTQLPYACDALGCTINPKLLRNYFEWRQNEKKCVYGNWMLRKFCEEPGQRIPGKFKEEGVEKKGDEDDLQPVFIPNGLSSSQGKMDYIQSTGKCNITKEYCNSFGSLWKLKGSGENAECDQTTGTKILEYIIPPTFMQGFDNLFEGADFCKGGGHREDFKLLTPKKISVLADLKEAAKSSLMISNVGGKGVHLYAVTWKKTPKKLQVTFSADEVQKLYPEYVKVKKNKKYIEMTKKDGAKSKELQRIYTFLANQKII